MLSLELRFEYLDAGTAETIMKALAPDNEGYVESEIVGNRLVFRIESDNAGTMRNTADDLIACIKIAEETVGLGSALH